ncbi:FYVE, RhoGEF and PH domain-containing protein 5 isoform X2 [Protopterus annectens]|uniref:FYVE, RhoGEF and PH domain-containing protein 5 isoform X2 n=1 Tax=Protopterus annectens TaxID=7888 RepID=UPI001CFB75C1|nr:FYVE, RhoGEF and PH domain-containing protein 5 isoform X2 [Protopterus annectens]
MNTDYKKPPLAPKPKLLCHLTSVAVSRLPASLISRPGLLQSQNSVTRGPKPPIAPKPKWPTDAESNASIQKNNNLNRCSNGKLIFSGEYFEESQCDDSCLEPVLEAEDDEYIVIHEEMLKNEEVEAGDEGDDDDNADNQANLHFGLDTDAFCLETADHADEQEDYEATDSEKCHMDYTAGNKCTGIITHSEWEVAEEVRDSKTDDTADLPLSKEAAMSDILECMTTIYELEYLNCPDESGMHCRSDSLNSEESPGNVSYEVAFEEDLQTAAPIDSDQTLSEDMISKESVPPCEEYSSEEAHCNQDVFLEVAEDVKTRKFSDIEETVESLIEDETSGLEIEQEDESEGTSDLYDDQSLCITNDLCNSEIDETSEKEGEVYLYNKTDDSEKKHTFQYMSDWNSKFQAYAHVLQEAGLFEKSPEMNVWKDIHLTNCKPYDNEELASAESDSDIAASNSECIPRLAGMEITNEIDQLADEGSSFKTAIKNPSSECSFNEYTCRNDAVNKGMEGIESPSKGFRAEESSDEGIEECSVDDEASELCHMMTSHCVSFDCKNDFVENTLLEEEAPEDLMGLRRDYTTDDSTEGNLENISESESADVHSDLMEGSLVEYITDVDIKETAADTGQHGGSECTSVGIIQEDLVEGTRDESLGDERDCVTATDMADEDTAEEVAPNDPSIKHSDVSECCTDEESNTAAECCQEQAVLLQEEVGESSSHDIAGDNVLEEIREEEHGEETVACSTEGTVSRESPYCLDNQISLVEPITVTGQSDVKEVSHATEMIKENYLDKENKYPEETEQTENVYVLSSSPCFRVAWQHPESIDENPYETTMPEYKVEGDNKEQENIKTDRMYLDEYNFETDGNILSVDRKSIVTRTRSLSGKIPGNVPETVPEEAGPELDSQLSNENPYTETANEYEIEPEHYTESNKLVSGKTRHFLLYPRSYSVEGRDISVSVYSESDGSLDETRIKRKDDNLSLPCVIGSSGSFSQRTHISSSGMSTPSSVVDIPPPFELASITKKPITKSSPSLLIENDSPDKYTKKKKSSFKKFLTLKFRKKTENKVHVEVNVSSSRSSSESSYHGPSRVLEIDRRSLGSSPQLKSRSGKVHASDSPSAFLLSKDGKRKGPPRTFCRSIVRVESFEDHSRPPFMPLPLTKPRSISFPNADTSDYENIPAINSDYENIQIPPRRPTRPGTFIEFFEDPSRALASASENDGYVDMSSFAGFDTKQQTPEQETESAYTEPYKVCPISLVPLEDVTSDEDQDKSSGDEGSCQGEQSLDKNDGQPYLIAKELATTEKIYTEMLKMLHVDLRESISTATDEDGGAVIAEENLNQVLCQLPHLCSLHQEILNEVQERISNWEEHRKMADIFLSRASQFNVYKEYIAQYDSNEALFDTCCLKSPHLRRVIHQFERRPGCRKMNIKHLLMKVVQRVLQYRLLLTDYLNNLCPDSAEYEDTQAALVVISEVTDQVTDSMKQGENLQKLGHIEYSVKGQNDLLQPGRMFIKEGTLMKISGDKIHPRHLFLLNDVLLYTYPQKDGKFRLRSTFPISDLKITRPLLEKVQNVLKIECAKRCLTLSASSCSERDEWYNYIGRTVQEYARAQNASNCYANMEIVCRNCSRNKCPLSYLKDRPAKVCNECYAKLTKREMSDPRENHPPSKSSSSAFSSMFHSISYSSLRKPKKIPSALKQAAASGEGSSMKGYLHRCKRGKKHWKKHWFVIKDKVLYTYAANEDKIALESLPLLGFGITQTKKEGNVEPGSVFQIYHKETLFYSFKAEDPSSAQRWMEAMREASVL